MIDITNELHYLNGISRLLLILSAYNGCDLVSVSDSLWLLSRAQDVIIKQIETKLDSHESQV